MERLRPRHISMRSLDRAVREIASAVLLLLQTGGGGALATVVQTRGSVPQQPGARLLWRQEGPPLGTVGGGAIEALVLEQLEEVFRLGTPRLLRTDLTRDLGMCCGGRMEIFLEPLQAQPRLLLFGAGHIAVPTARLASSIGFEVHAVDDREELLTAARFPTAERHSLDAAAFIKRDGLSPHDWLLIVTHDHRLDEELLELAAQRPHAYIGLVGSRRKVIRIVERVRARQPQVALDRVYAPVGLDLGAVSPEEIAVSIVAEWIALRRDKMAPHLRMETI